MLSGTSGHLVPAGAQRLEEAEAIDGDQSGRIQDAQLLVLPQDTVLAALVVLASGLKTAFYKLLTYSRLITFSLLH